MLWVELMLAVLVVVGGGAGAGCGVMPGTLRPLVVEPGRDMTTDAGYSAGGSRRRVPRGSRRLRLVVHHERILEVVRQRRLECALLERAAHGKHARGSGGGGCRGRGLGGHRGCVRRVRRRHLLSKLYKLNDGFSQHSPPGKKK